MAAARTEASLDRSHGAQARLCSMMLVHDAGALQKIHFTAGRLHIVL